MSTEALTRLEKLIGSLSKIHDNDPENQMVIDIVTEHFEESTNEIRGKEKVMKMLKSLSKDLTEFEEISHALIKLIKGNFNVDDERMEQTDLEIIESGYLLTKFKTNEDFENATEKQLRLHKHSYIYHCLASPSVYEMRFPKKSPNKKQK